jgi:hypothetical protein
VKPHWGRKFLRSVKGCTRLDKITNDGIRKKQNIYSRERSKDGYTEE